MSELRPYQRNFTETNTTQIFFAMHIFLASCYSIYLSTGAKIIGWVDKNYFFQNMWQLLSSFLMYNVTQRKNNIVKIFFLNCLSLIFSTWQRQLTDYAIAPKDRIMGVIFFRRIRLKKIVTFLWTVPFSTWLLPPL